MNDFKFTEIELAGRKLLLTERTIEDAIALERTNFNNQSESDIIVYKSISIVHAALSWNYKSLPWYKFIQKYFLRRKLSYKNLMKLSTSKIIELSNEVFKLEGLVDKKKVITENE